MYNDTRSSPGLSYQHGLGDGGKDPLLTLTLKPATGTVPDEAAYCKMPISCAGGLRGWDGSPTNRSVCTSLTHNSQYLATLTAVWSCRKLIPGRDVLSVRSSEPINGFFTMTASVGVKQPRKELPYFGQNAPRCQLNSPWIMVQRVSGTSLPLGV